MIDLDRIDELDGNGAADALVAARVKLREAEAERLLLAAHWADLHAAEELCAAELALSPRSASGRVQVLPGCERMVPSGADGTPEIEEFAPAELAALLGVATGTGGQLIADATNLRHRHPAGWASLTSSTTPLWLLVQVARRCAAVGLTLAQARWVDAETTPYLATLPPGRFLRLVEAKIVAADPDAADARAREASLARFVRTGQTDEYGLKTLVARASAGDIIHVVAVVDRIAVILADQGDPDPMDARRATALRTLANPARALALLAGATQDHLDPALERNVLGEEENDEPGGYDWRHDPDGNLTLPQLPDHREPPVDESAGGEARGEGRGGDAACSVLDPALLQRLITALEGFDALKLDPVTVFHVHLTDTTLLSGVGVVRVDELGPLVLAAVRDWLTHPTAPVEIAHRVTIRPVLDTGSIAPVDRYEMPPLMAEALKIRQPHTVFPFRHHLDERTSRRRPPGTVRPDGRGRVTRADRSRQAGLPRPAPSSDQDTWPLAPRPSRPRHLVVAHPARPLAEGRPHGHHAPRPRPRPRRPPLCRPRQPCLIIAAQPCLRRCAPSCSPEASGGGERSDCAARSATRGAPAAGRATA